MSTVFDRRRKWPSRGPGVLLVASLVLLGLWLWGGWSAAASAGDPGDVPRFEPAACPVAVPGGVPVACGYLVVPEDRGRPAGRTIRLAVVILESRSQDPAPDPIVYLEGGPGGSAVEWLAGWIHSPFLEMRDFVLLEQRGTRYAQPWLACPEVDAAILENLGTADSEEQESSRRIEAAVQCRDRLLAAGVNLAAYNSAEIAADVEDLRQVLGYEQWNLYGISNGTRLALTVMRDHPRGVRCAILDSTFPPQSSGYVELLPNAAHALDRLFAACASDPACSAAYPDLEATFSDLIARMDARPVPVTIAHPDTGRPFELAVTGGDLAGGLFYAMYDENLIPFLPLLVDQLYRGNRDLLLPMAQNSLSSLFGTSRGMNLSVECHDEAPFSSPQALSAAVEAHPHLRGLVQFFPVDVCPHWGAGAAGPVEAEAVHSDIPTLILAGEFDPITPPFLGRLAAETLPHSYFFEFPGLAHAVTLADCPRSMALAFLDDPTAAPDAGCMAAMAGPDFFTARDLYLTPAIYRLNVDLLARRPPLHLGLLGFGLVFFLVEILLLPGRAIRRLRRCPTAGRTPPSAAWARALAVAAAGLNLAFLLGLALAIRDAAAGNWIVLAFGLPSGYAPLFLLPLLAALSTLCLVVAVWRSWRQRSWTILARAHLALFTLAAVAFLWFLAYWDLLALPF